MCISFSASLRERKGRNLAAMLRQTAKKHQENKPRPKYQTLQASLGHFYISQQCN